MSRSDYAADGRPPRRTRRQETRWDTQDAAWESIQPRAGSIAAKVLEAITNEPMTCDEVEQRLGLTHQTCSAAIHHLMKDGAVVADGVRPTRSGRTARVWRKSDGNLFSGVSS